MRVLPSWVAAASTLASGFLFAQGLQVIYVPTPREVVTEMLRLANVGRNDVVYDIGSGDGRIVIAAVKDFGASRGVGIDLDDARIQEATQNARAAGVADRVTFLKQDMYAADVRDATVITLYMSQAINRQLYPKFVAETKPGTRIVSHFFDMGDIMPNQTRTISGRMVFLWIIPSRS